MALRLLGHSPGGWTLLGHSPGLVDTFSDTLQEWQVPLIRLLTLSCCSVTFSIIFFKLCSHIHMHFCDVGFPPLLGRYPVWLIPHSETLRGWRTPFTDTLQDGHYASSDTLGICGPLLGHSPALVDTFSDPLQEWRIPRIRLLAPSCCSMIFQSSELQY